MPNQAKHPHVDQSLQYRWGIVGFVLVVLLIGLFLRSNGERFPFMNTKPSESTQNLAKIPCPRCNNDPVKKKDCSLCGGLGFIWVDTSKDLPKASATK
jgi:hypothetical protein